MATTYVSSSSRALLFAGQGTDVSASVKKLVAGPRGTDARTYFARASTVLGYDLLDLCVNDPIKLATTAFSQPAIMVAQLATACCSPALVAVPPYIAAHGLGAETCDEEIINSATAVTHLAGFSLGEYAALVFGGAMRFEDGVRLIKLRAEAMEQACADSPGGMVTIVGLSDAALEALCADALKACPAVASAGGSIAIANHLFPTGRVLSGHVDLVEWAGRVAPTPKYGAMAATKLPVAGAFHSAYMASAKATLLAALAETAISMPRVPVYSNVTAAPYESPEQIKELLAQQLESPVRWEQTIKAMLAAPGGGVGSFVDAGPGKQLKSMMNRIDKKAFQKTAVLEA